MLNLVSIVVILLVTSDFGYSDVSHHTDCDFNKACVECHATGDKIVDGYVEAKIPYQNALVNGLNTYRNKFAIDNNISNMVFSIWMNGYHDLMKNITIDVGERNVTCIDRLTGDFTHFSVAEVSRVPARDTVTPNEILNELILSLMNSTRIVAQFDTSRFGCFFGIDNNRVRYILRCLYFTEIDIHERQINGPACTNCGGRQCSNNYKGLCGSLDYVESSASLIKRGELCIINAILILVLSLKLGF